MHIHTYNTPYTLSYINAHQVGMFTGATIHTRNGLMMTINKAKGEGSAVSSVASTSTSTTSLQADASIEV